MKKTLSLVLSLMLVASLFAGLTITASAEEVPVVTVATVNLDHNIDKDWYPDDTIKHMEEVLGIDIEWSTYDDDQLALAMASNELADVTMGGTVNNIIAAGVAVPMDDYLEEYGQNILKYTLRNELLRKYCSGGTGKLLIHTPNTGYEDKTGGSSPWNGYLVRWDLYAELGYPEMVTYDDYIEVLKQMVALYPTNENGDQTYAFGLWNDSGLWSWLMGTIANMGYSSIGDWNFVWDTKTNEFVNQITETDESNSPWWTAMRFYNELYNEGLLDPDSFSMMNDELDEKYANNRYVGGVCTWYVGQMYSTNREADESTLAGIMAVPVKGGSGWYGQNAIIGWDGKNMYVTTSCEEENIPNAIRFIDYLDSDDGNRTCYSGVQGVTWDYDASGVPTLTQEIIDKKSAGGDTWNQCGIQCYENEFGSSAWGVAEDGYYYNLFNYDLGAGMTPLQQAFCDHYGISYPGELRYQYEQNGEGYSQAISLHTTIGALQGEVPDEVSTITSRINEMMIREVKKLVTAESYDAFEAEKESFINECKDAGIETAEAWYRDTWTSLATEIQAIIDAQ